MSRPVVCAQTEFRAIGTTNRILATDLAVLPEATAIARDYLDALDRAVSRFRTDSEVCRLAVSAAAGPASALMSPCLLYTSPSPRDRTRTRMPSSA